MWGRKLGRENKKFDLGDVEVEVKIFCLFIFADKGEPNKSTSSQISSETLDKLQKFSFNLEHPRKRIHSETLHGSHSVDLSKYQHSMVGNNGISGSQHSHDINKASSSHPAPQCFYIQLLKICYLCVSSWIRPPALPNASSGEYWQHNISKSGDRLFCVSS